MATGIKAPKKLIEVALPLDDINAAAAREKSIRDGHPSTLHLWWARRPLAAARAVLFAQLVNDPGGERGYYKGKTKAQADTEREALFNIIRDLVKWENTNNEEVLERARAAIRKSWRETCLLNDGKPGFDPDTLPAFHDPFAGGGAIPLEALETMIGSKLGVTPIAPVDLSQSAIGPGMAIFSRYAAVLEADGTPMSVHNALVMINKEVDDFLNPSGSGFDADTQFCSAWFDQHGWGAGKFGEADVLARAKGTSVAGVAESGVVESGAGKVRLFRWEEYASDWDPIEDNRTPVWEACHQLIRALNQQGEFEAGRLLARMPERGEAIRQLTYRLYTLCERKKWAEDARAYNELIGAWHGIVEASHEIGHIGTQQSLDL